MPVPSYADRVAERPNCWGAATAYDPKDDECESCRYQHTCRAEVQRTGGSPYSIPSQPSSAYAAPRRTVATSPYSSQRPTYQTSRMNFEEVEWAPGPIDENDKPLTRFFKDSAAGGVRGTFFEAYRFWKVFRLK